MKVLTTIAFGILFLLLANPLLAQTQGGLPVPLSPDTLAARQANSLTRQLSLTEQQQRDVMAAATQLHKSLQELNTEKVKDKALRSHALQQMHHTYESALQKTLTSEQWKAYEKGVAEKRAAFLKHAQEKKIPIRELEKQ